jgi:hypothetical protein
MSFNEKLQKYVDRYRAAGITWPATAKEIAAWVIRMKLWEPTHEFAVAKCAEEISDAMRDEYYTDKQGRRVRAKHALRLGRGAQQRTLWGDYWTYTRHEMAMAFGQRRAQIVGDCLQLKTDVDSYNQNVNKELPVQLSLDLTLDVAEKEALLANRRTRPA